MASNWYNAPIPAPRPPSRMPTAAANPFLDFWAKPGVKDFASNALTDLGYGLAHSTNFGNALTAAQDYSITQAPQRAQQAQLAQQQAEANQTMDWVKQTYPQFAHLPPAQAYELASKQYAADHAASSQSDPASVEEYKFYANQEMKGGRSPMSYADWRKGANSTVRAGLGQPIVLRNKQTKEAVPFMPMSDGTYMNPLTGQQADDQWEFDPAYVAAQRAAGTAYGTQQGGAQFNLPKAGQDVGFELQNIDAILNDKAGLADTFGKIGGIWPQQWNPIVDPNSPRAELKTRIDQVVGQNFLQAYSTLRGAGAITEAEGAKAQEAMGRITTAQNQKAFEQALADLKEVLQAGYTRMQQQASTVYEGTGAAGGTQPPAPNAGLDTLKQKYGLQ